MRYLVVLAFLGCDSSPSIPLSSPHGLTVLSLEERTVQNPIPLQASWSEILGCLDSQAFRFAFAHYIPWTSLQSIQFILVDDWEFLTLQGQVVPYQIDRASASIRIALWSSEPDQRPLLPSLESALGEYFLISTP